MRFAPQLSTWNTQKPNKVRERVSCSWPPYPWSWLSQTQGHPGRASHIFSLARDTKAMEQYVSELSSSGNIRHLGHYMARRIQEDSVDLQGPHHVLALCSCSCDFPVQSRTGTLFLHLSCSCSRLSTKAWGCHLSGLCPLGPVPGSPPVS